MLFLPFFERHPSLPVALFLLLGLSLSLECSLALLLVFLSLLSPFYRKKKQIVFLVLCAFAAWIYGKNTLPFFPKHLQTIEGTAHFIPQEIKEHHTHYKTTYYVKGVLSSIGEASDIPCSLSLLSTDLPLKATKYQVQGTLQKTSSGYIFVQSANWIPLKTSSFNLVEHRFRYKQALSKWIRSQYKNPRVSSFLTALVVGELDDTLLRYSFSRLGLQHILAISGFHFGLLALFLGWLFRLLLRGKAFHLSLLLALTLYFLFLGPSPSITRAYFSAVLYLIGKMGQWRTNALNLFGVVLLLELLLFPGSLQTLGFQFSFLATGSILFLYPITVRWMERLLPKRTKVEVLALNVPSRFVYRFCCFLRSSFALNLAVHMTMVPICLLYFEQFPLMSFAYNLFLPLAVSGTLCVFFATLPFFLLCPPLATKLCYCNEVFTGRILSLIVEAPARLDIFLYNKFFSKELVLAWLLFLFALAIYKRKKQKTLLDF